MTAEFSKVAALPVDVTSPVKFAFVTTVVELPTLVTIPVRFAFVVTDAAFPPILKFATGVVEVTINGAVPVAIVEINWVPDKVPAAATDDGVIAPNVNVIAGVVVGVATAPLMPFAVVTETDVTVPLFPAVHVGTTPAPPF